MTPPLQVVHVSKSFPGVKALKDVNFTLKPSSVHVLCGENGAGKSTLVKIISGIYQPDEGELYVLGKRVHINNPLEAKKMKISMIYQELDYVEDFTVEQSLFLGEEPVTKFGRIDWKSIRKKTKQLLEQENLPYLPYTRLRDLSLSDIQILEILKAVSLDARIILMDEPTSSISDKEIQGLFDKIFDLRKKGVGVIYISHKIDEIFQIADEISVLRDGVLVDTKPSKELNKKSVINKMVGRKIENVYPKRKERTLGKKIIEIDSLTSEPKFYNVSLHAREGEIVGISGLVGAGRTEVARAVFGLDQITSGIIKIHGKEVEIRDVFDAIKNKIAMLSEDKKRYGLILERDVKENVSLVVLERFFKRGWNRSSIEYQAVNQICKKLNVKTPSLLTLVKSLSGGNQQKVVLAKWLLKDQDILILDEPTRGIDVGAKFEIYKLIHELAEQGKAIIMISSEMPELIGVCDRMYVMAGGTITKELQREEFDQETIMKYSASGSVK